MHHIRWFAEAEDSLATLWLNGDSSFRRTLGARVNEMERSLSADPFQESESREGEERILLKLPLAMLFDVDEATAAVWVSDVWRF